MEVTLTSRRAVVERLLVLDREFIKTARKGIELAREAGMLLLAVPRKERREVMQLAGLKRSSGYVYLKVARRWNSVQHAGLSLRAFLDAETTPRALPPASARPSVRKPEEEPEPIKMLTGSGLADDLVRMLGGIEPGRTVAITISAPDRKKSQPVRTDDDRQMLLPFE